MAKALVLGAVKTKFLGPRGLLTATDVILAEDVSNRILMGAWLNAAEAVISRGLYGALSIRVGTLANLTEGIALKDGWFSTPVTSTTIHEETVAWYGELPLFDERPISIVFFVRNDSGVTITFTAGYAWKEVLENDRPS